VEEVGEKTTHLLSKELVGKTNRHPGQRLNQRGRKGMIQGEWEYAPTGGRNRLARKGESTLAEMVAPLLFPNSCKR